MQNNNTEGKLLKIQTSLLEALLKELNNTPKESMNYEQIRLKLETELEKYKELVTTIDKEIYHDLQEKVIKLQKSKLTLEEELKQLEDLEIFYKQFIQIGNTFKETYSKYSKEPLELSPQENLNINTLLRRKAYIRGYLQNKLELNRYKAAIEKYNEELSEQEKKHNKLMTILTEFDEILIKGINSLEGRIISKDDSKLSYTSIKEEYASIGIYLAEEGYTGLSLPETIKENGDAKEKLSVATMSYEAIPSPDNLAILNEIKLETTTSNYRLALIKIADEVYRKSEDYDSAISKREKINDLLKYRKEYLESLGVKYGIDPFTRLDISEQISRIKNYENTSQSITRLRGQIAKLNTKIEELEISNNEYLIWLDNYELTEEPKYIKQDISTDKKTFKDFEKATPIVISKVPSNQVIAVSSPKKGLNLTRCCEKATSVGERIYALLTEDKKNNKSNPQLVIDKKTVVIKEVSTPIIEKEDDPDLFATTDEIFDSKKDNLFKEVNPFDKNEEENPFAAADEIFTSEKDDNTFEEMPPFEEVPDDIPTIQDEMFTSVENKDIFKENDSTSKPKEEEIFQEIKPFEEPSLYSDKQEDPFEKKEDIFPSQSSKPIADYSLEMTKIKENNRETPIFWLSQEDTYTRIKKAS